MLKLGADPEVDIEDCKAMSRISVECSFLPMLTSEKLTAEIPDFVWDGGHSGQLLNEEQADKLNQLWNEYLDENADIFKPRAARVMYLD